MGFGMSNLAGLPPLGLRAPKPVNGTKAGRDHMGRVKALPCVVCLHPGPSEAHHCRSDGMARDDFKTIPLCFWCHRGPRGYHAEKASWEERHGKDHEFLAVVADMLAGEWNDPRGRTR